MRPINVGLSPNTEPDDVALAVELMKKPGEWLEGGAVAELESVFKKKFGVKNAFAFQNGRSALQAVIESLRLEPGDEVLVQSFTCVVVPNAIIWGGGKPVYVDVDNDFNMSGENLVKKITPKSRAIIVQHTFGSPADMDSIIAIAREHKLAIIEDCAHALGAKYKGQPVGSLGDAAIFSFGRDKVVSSVFGGMAITNHPELADELQSIKHRLKSPDKKWIKMQLRHPILMHKLVLPRYNGLGKIILEISKRFNLISKAVTMSERATERGQDSLLAMPNALALLALHQLEKLDKLNQHRRDLAEIYAKEVKEVKGVQLPPVKHEETDSESIFLRYSIATPKATELIREGRKRNILLDDWYNPAIAPAGTDNTAASYNPESCPNAERLSKLVVNLPTNINTTQEDALKVVELIKEIHR